MTTVSVRGWRGERDLWGKGWDAWNQWKYDRHEHHDQRR